MATLICPHCGMANRAGANFCNNCGTDLRAEEAPLPANVEPAPDLPAEAEVKSVKVEVTISREDEDGGADDERGRAPAEDEAASASETWLAEQPWLQTADDVLEPVDEPMQPSSGRTIAGVQGLLPLLNLSRRAPDSQSASAGSTVMPGFALSPEQASEVRFLMGDTPAPMAETLTLPAPRQRPSLHIPWLFWLLGLAVALPVFLLLRDPGGTPRQWPGVQEAYNSIAALPPDAAVLVSWAYDPATAGEMDLLAVPVVRQLLDQQANLTVVSLLPGGPATARRAVADALFYASDDVMLDTTERFAMADQRLVENLFLPGGVAALPLVAQAPGTAFGSEDDSVTAEHRAALAQTPALTIVFAARAEDVQSWLEQVKPLNGAPVVAITSAGADPLLRPYLDSGQLAGLVSGFDGAYAYERLTGESRSLDGEEQVRVRLAAQNWGQLALLLILVVGNLAGLFGRGRRA